MDEEIIPESPPQRTSNISASAWIPNAVASTSSIPSVRTRTSEDIPMNLIIEPQLLDTPLQASATLEPDRAPVDLPDSPLLTNSFSRDSRHPIIDDPDQQDVFELFHDALELLASELDANDDTLLTVTSTSTDEAADALYPRLRQLFATGKAEPLPPFSATSICNLDIKALDRTKISANM
jgi:hypothetical protein